MKKTFTLFLVAIALLGASTNKITAQTVPTVNEQFKISEMEPYFAEYFSPFAKAMSVSMSGGWAHTANVHGVLGFDITLSASVAKVPTEDLTFNPTTLNMPGYTFGSTSTPTIAGSSDLPKASITRSFNSEPPVSINGSGIQGNGISYGGMASLQGSIGLPKGTELILRFIPNVSKPTNNLLSNSGTDVTLAKTGMWGFGVKHDIKQWIPVLAKVPFLQISGLFTYSKFYTGFSGGDMSVKPDDFGAVDNTGNSWDNQRFDIGISSLTGNLLIGASIPVFQPYIGIGFNSAKFKGGLMGDYPVIDLNGTTFEVNEVDTDPLVAEVNATNFNFQAGARIKLGFFVFHYTFTKQQYSMHTGGLAFTFR